MVMSCWPQAPDCALNLLCQLQRMRANVNTIHLFCSGIMPVNYIVGYRFAYFSDSKQRDRLVI